MRIGKSLIVIALGALAPTAVLAAGMAQAQKAIERGDYSIAVGQLRPLAARGDARAEEALGALYDAGLGVAPDAVRAAKLFRAAARQGSEIGRAHV